MPACLEPYFDASRCIPSDCDPTYWPQRAPTCLPAILATANRKRRERAQRVAVAAAMFSRHLLRFEYVGRAGYASNIVII